MNEQLQEIADDFEAAQERMHALHQSTADALWERRPVEGSWSAAECIDHLNKTSEAFLPILTEGLERARARPAWSGRRYRRDLFGWLLWRAMGPPVRVKLGTAAPFVPGSLPPRDALIERFEQLQREQMDLIEAADGLPLSEIRVPSAFDARVRYNLFSCMSILPRHQHRHLWQAERAVRS